MRNVRWYHPASRYNTQRHSYALSASIRYRDERDRRCERALAGKIFSLLSQPLQQLETTQLASMLKNATSSDVINRVESRFVQKSLPEYLEELLAEKSLSKAEVIRASMLNSTFAYQIMSGDRHASRDKILQLIFALSCTVDEANKVLYAGGASTLYCRNKRDAIIVFALEHGLTLTQVDTLLYEQNEPTIVAADA